jgi:putative thioredoxin
MERVIEANDADFKEKIIEASKGVPIVVDFWAEWCMPCMMISPVLEKLAEEYAGKFILAKVDVDEAHQAAQTYRIMSIPCVKMFKNGELADEFIGALPEAQVREWLGKNLG